MLALRRMEFGGAFWFLVEEAAQEQMLNVTTCCCPPRRAARLWAEPQRFLGFFGEAIDVHVDVSFLNPPSFGVSTGVGT